MMYNNKLAVAVKHNGKVLREVGESVFIPFGSEYSLFIKNLNNVRARVNIEIDGEAVGNGFIVDGNRSIDIERFIKNGNLKEGNRFKFIERSSDIEQHRGVGVEDGLIRVEFEFEYDYKYIFGTYQPAVTYTPVRGVDDRLYGNRSQDYVDRGINITCSTTRSFTNASNSTHDCFTAPQNEAGITVPGSISSQEFRTVADIVGDGTKHVMVLRLLGETEDNQRVIKPVTVKAKPKCVTCGRTNKANAKFCSNCGTSLVLI